MSTASGSLWNYAVDIYGRPGVTEACLDLQDRSGAEVNMMLFCLWCADRDMPFTAHLAQARALSRDWQDSLIVPLRLCRRDLKSFAARPSLSATDRSDLLALRERVKSSELAAERRQLDALEDLVTSAGDSQPTQGPRREAATAYLNLYFSAAGIALDPLGQSHVLRIVDAAFGAHA